MWVSLGFHSQGWGAEVGERHRVTHLRHIPLQEMESVNPWLPGFTPQAQGQVRASLHRGDLRDLLESKRRTSKEGKRQTLTTRSKKRRRHRANKKAKKGIPAALKILGRDVEMEDPEVAPQEELPGPAGLQEVDATIGEVANLTPEKREASKRKPIRWSPRGKSQWKPTPGTRRSSG